MTSSGIRKLRVDGVMRSYSGMTWTRRTRIRFSAENLRKGRAEAGGLADLDPVARVAQRRPSLFRNDGGNTLADHADLAVKANSSSASETSLTPFTLPFRRNRMTPPA